jgi:hypothetical protein
MVLLGVGTVVIMDGYLAAISMGKEHKARGQDDAWFVVRSEKETRVAGEIPYGKLYYATGDLFSRALRRVMGTWQWYYKRVTCFF